jgi:hypothetical protein
MRIGLVDLLLSVDRFDHVVQGSLANNEVWQLRIDRGSLIVRRRRYVSIAPQLGATLLSMGVGRIFVATAIVGVVRFNFRDSDAEK